MTDSSIRIRSKRQDNHAQLRILIAHPMENGRNKDPDSGQYIPAHFIQTLSIFLNGTQLLEADLSGSIAKDPFFRFALNQVAAGDKVLVRWEDNTGLSDQREHIIR